MATGRLFTLVSFIFSPPSPDRTVYGRGDGPTSRSTPMITKKFSKEATAQLKQTSGKDQNNLLKLTPAKFVLILIGLSFIFQLFRWTSPRRQHAPRDWTHAHADAANAKQKRNPWVTTCACTKPKSQIRKSQTQFKPITEARASI